MKHFHSMTAGYKRTFACRTDIREMGLELIRNAQKISVHGLGVDVGRLESDEKSQCSLSWLNVKCVESTEG